MNQMAIMKKKVASLRRQEEDKVNQDKTPTNDTLDTSIASNDDDTDIYPDSEEEDFYSNSWIDRRVQITPVQ